VLRYLLTFPALAALLERAKPLRLPGLRARQASKSEMYDLLYRLNWGETTTNNYGFAPAESDGPERHQIQLYVELDKLRRAESGQVRPGRVLEVSCGRGGGLAHLAAHWGEGTEAVGLDWSWSAIRFCARRHGRIGHVAFLCGSALALPFAPESFDCVINVEASNAYGDEAAFHREAHRLLRPGGLFLYADLRRPRHMAALAENLAAAGFSGEIRDITAHVLRACAEDSARRHALIRSGLPWPLRAIFRRRLEHYAAVPGSKKYERFRTGRRVYFLTCQRKAG
jgi:SAM-dependent methyltransferase